MPDQISIKGRIISAYSKKGIGALLVELWSKNRPSSKISFGQSNAEGNFELPLTGKEAKEWLSKRNAKAYFKIFQNNVLALNTEESYIWKPADTAPVSIEVNIKEKEETPTSKPVAETASGRINSFSELMLREKEVLDMIRRMPNGGNLFMAHPILFLKEIAGLQLSENALSELIAREPILANLKDDAFRVLKNNPSVEQHITFEVRGLFKK